MKIFIIGKQIGLKPQDVREKFLNAASLLESLNLEPVVPSFTDDPESGTFAQRLGQEVETLAGCDGVLMLDNWRQSKKADIERTIARKLGKPVMYQDIVSDNANRKIAELVEDAVSQVTGLTIEEFSGKSRCRERCYARMLFVYHCRKFKMRLVAISRYVHRDHTTMLHYLKKYNDEIVYNREFGELANKCAQIIKEKENEICIKKPNQD